MRMLVVGGQGQLGTEVCRTYAAAGHEVLAPPHTALDVVDAGACRTFCREAKPDLLINCAALHQLEVAEADPAQAFAVNALGPRNLALLSAEFDFALVQVSTDYVFDGSKGAPYVESDPPQPLNVYGNSKLAGEYFVRALAPRHYITRVSALFGAAPCRGKNGHNFVRSMLEKAQAGRPLRVVDDEIISPTYTVDAARQLLALTQSDRYGVYHMAGGGQCSWYELAAAVFRLVGIKASLSRARPGEFAGKIRRPKCSALENRGLQQLGLQTAGGWEKGVSNYLQEMAAKATAAGV